MAKKEQVKHHASENHASADAPVQAHAEAQAAPAEAKKAPVGVRGPKGVALDALIFVKTEGGVNPKRPGSKAHDVFSNYKDGMTVQQFMDKVGEPATPNLVYDAAHGFITIEGYNPKLVVKKERAPAKAKEPKAPRAKKEPKGESAETTAAKAELEQDLQEEIL